MKILYIIQQSIYNNNKKWLSADSNIQIFSGFVDQILKKTNWEIDAMVAPLEDFADITSYNSLLIEPNKYKVKFIPRKSSVDAFANRYNFDVEWMRKILRSGNYDVIINNIIELSRNIKTILHFDGLKAKIVSGNYWIDCPMVGEEKVPLEVSYDFRQIDGAECSDLVPFTCESTKEIFFDNLYNRIKDKKICKKIMENSTIWDFGFSATELNLYNPKVKNSFQKKTIIFPNRLSGMNYTHHKEFIEAVNRLYLERDDFQVIFTNPSQKISWDELRDKVVPFYLLQKAPLNREQYVTLLWNADVIVSLYTIERYGGCANVEGIYCENYPVMTYFGEYPYRVEDKFPFVDTNKGMVNLKAVLNRALNECDTEDHQKKLYRKNRVYLASSYEIVSDKVIEDIKRMVGE